MVASSTVLPLRGVSCSSLKKLAGTPLPPSSHEVTRVQFQDKYGITQRGFYKACDPTYSAEHARWVVMFSIELRLAIGDRAPEELPVFDDNGALIGTLSIEIPNFKPMLSEGEVGPENFEDFNSVCPDASTLVDRNIAEVLWARLRRQEDDLHEKNLGLVGGIDLDMLWWRDISSHLKGKRIVSGIIVPDPKDAFDLPASDLDVDFPCPKKTRPYFWPTYPPNPFTKCFRNAAAFKELNNPGFPRYKEFQEQKYAAMLKELLMYDEQVLKSRMSLYCNDEMFIKRSLYFFSQKQKEIYKKVVNEMPGFKEFIRHPEHLKTALQWFIKANNEQSFPQDAKYSIERIKSRFLDIWKDCHVSLFNEVLKKFEIMANLSRQVSAESMLSFQGKEMVDEDFIKVDATTKQAYLPNNEHLLNSIADFNTELQLITEAFFDNIDLLEMSAPPDIMSGDALFYKDSIINISHFHSLLTSLTHLLTKAHAALEENQMASPELKEKWNMVLLSLEEAAKTIALPSDLCELYSTVNLSSLLNSSGHSRAVDETLFAFDRPLLKTHAQKLDDAIEIFYKWLQNLTPANFKKNVQTAYDEYKTSIFQTPIFGIKLFSYLDPTKLTRRRGDKILESLQHIDKLATTEPQANDLTLPEWEKLTAEGEWNETSFNVKLMHEFCKDIIADLRDPLVKIKMFGTNTEFVRFFNNLTPDELKTIRQKICDKWAVDQIKPFETRGDFRSDWLASMQAGPASR